MMQCKQGTKWGRARSHKMFQTSLCRSLRLTPRPWSKEGFGRKCTVQHIFPGQFFLVFAIRRKNEIPKSCYAYVSGWPQPDRSHSPDTPFHLSHDFCERNRHWLPNRTEPCLHFLAILAELDLRTLDLHSAKLVLVAG